MERLLLMFALGSLTSCVAVPTSQVVPIEGEYIPTKSKVAPVCVVVPDDGSFDGRAYIGSGKLVAERVVATLDDIGMPSILVSSVETAQPPSCVEAGSELRLDSQILAYENHVTGWSGKPDRIQVRLSLSLMAEPSRSRNAIYIAQSNLIASGFLEWGNADPTALLGRDFGKLVRELCERM